MNLRLILFDELASVLDPEMVKEVLDLVRSVAESGVTMIRVTHEMEFTWEAAGKVVFMDNGEIVEEGSPQQVFGSLAHERTKAFLSRFVSAKTPEYFL